MVPAVPAVGAYVRISEDADGLALGVARQEADCRKLADLRGWTIAEVYSDNDVSAYKPRVVRPGFERLLADLAGGGLGGVVVYDLDRLARKPKDLERIIDLFDVRPLVFATVQGDLDLSTSDGRTMARVMTAFANKASADTARRVTRKHLELAMSGVAVGGHRPFGYEHDKRTIRASEADLIRHAATDLLAGVGLHTIARRWNEAGVRATTGNLWRKTVLRNMLLSPRMAGFRVYRGGIARRPDGTAVTGLFEPILEVATWEAVVALLRDPARGKHVHLGGRKYLLAGIIRCGLCGGTLVGSANTRYHTFGYVCKSATNGGCGKVAISGPSTDRLITDLTLGYLADRVVPRDSGPWPGEQELAAVSGQVRELMDAYRRRELSGEVVFPAVSGLEQQAARLRAERSGWLRAQVAQAVQPVNAVEAWPALDTDQRRAVVASVLHSVVVRPATIRGNRYDPTRVEPVWR